MIYNPLIIILASILTLVFYYAFLRPICLHFEEEMEDRMLKRENYNKPLIILTTLSLSPIFLICTLATFFQKLF